MKMKMKNTIPLPTTHMASLQPPWLSSLNSINTTISVSPKPSLFHSTNLTAKTHQLKPFKISSSSQPTSSNSSSENSFAARIGHNPVEGSGGTANGVGAESSSSLGDSCGETKKIPDRVRIAMERAREYKKNKGLKGGNGFMELDFSDNKSSRRLPAGMVPISDPFPDGDIPEVEIIVGDASKFGNRTRSKPEQIQEDNTDLYKPKVSTRGVFPRLNNISKTYPLKPLEISSSADSSSQPTSSNSPENSFAARIGQNPVEGSGGTENGVGAGSSSGLGDGSGETKKIPDAVRIAMERAKEYKKNKGAVGATGGKKNGESETITGLKGGNGGNSGNGFMEDSVKKKEEPDFSSIDFMGLDFSDKKSRRGLPAGLVPISDPFPDGNIPEVEIIVGDASKFGNQTMSKPEQIQEDDMDIYKPKVSTWGVFPRPKNISKTFGGGRTIRPGDVLETAEVRAAKEERTRQLIAEYMKKKSSQVDPKIKSECEKALKDGDTLMDSGRLKEALPYYQEVIKKMVFQTELHGLAALKLSICQDSLGRHIEARGMYERLRNHPTAEVSKKARHFAASFEAMEMLKVRSSNFPQIDPGYEKYFQAFVRKDIYYPLQESEVDDGALNQALPYIIFLLSPIFMVLLLAIQKGHIK